MKISQEQIFINLLSGEFPKYRVSFESGAFILKSGPLTVKHIYKIERGISGWRLSKKRGRLAWAQIEKELPSIYNVINAIKVF